MFFLLIVGGFFPFFSQMRSSRDARFSLVTVLWNVCPGVCQQSRGDPSQEI